jgi:30S ribosomal protein S31
MGRGDKRTKKGKIFRSSFGNARLRQSEVLAKKTPAAKPKAAPAAAPAKKTAKKSG